MDIQFVNGFYDFSLWKKHPKFALIEMDQLNLLHWVIFYNRKRLLNHIISTYNDNDDHLHLGRAFTGDHPSFIYEFTN
jgi:hypothetical protein